MLEFWKPKTSGSPVSKYAEWKSETKTFAYYDKATNSKLPLTIKDAVLIKLSYAHKGWDDDSSQPIYSNEISDWNETITIRTKTGIIASGLHKDIKEKSPNSSINILAYILMNGELIQLSAKGSSYMEFSTFLKWFDHNSDTFSVTGSTPHKKGKVEYTTPIFSVGSAITSEQRSEAMAAVNAIGKKSASTTSLEESDDMFDIPTAKVKPSTEELHIDDIPF